MQKRRPLGFSAFIQEFLVHKTSYKSMSLLFYYCHWNATLKTESVLRLKIENMKHGLI